MSTTEPEKDRRLMLAVGTIVSILLHVVFLWLLSQTAMPLEYGSKVVSRPMMLVLIKESASSHPPPSSAMPDEKPGFQKPKAVKRSTHVPQATASLKAAKLVPGPSIVVRPAETLENSSEHEAAGVNPALAAQKRHTVGGPAVLQLDYRGEKTPQKSYAELANEKLNPGERTSAFADGIKSAEIPDCMKESQGGGLLALPIVIYRATTGKCN